MSGDDLVDDQAGRVDVHLRRGLLAPELLGGGVAQRAEKATRGLAASAVEHRDDAEVEELGDRDAGGRPVQEDVVGLHVAVDEAFVVGVVERVEKVDADVVRVGELELPLLLEDDPQRLAVEPLHHVVRQVQLVRGHAGRDDVDDVRVVQAREGARFVLHTPGEVFARTELRVKGLEDVALADRRVLDVVDGAHAADADESQHLVDGAGDVLAGRVVARGHGAKGGEAKV